MPGIAVDHGPEKRAEDEERADDAKENGGMPEEENFHEDEKESDNKERDCFPARQPGEVMPKKK